MAEHITQMIITILSPRFINMSFKKDLKKLVTTVSSPWIVKTSMCADTILDFLSSKNISSAESGFFKCDGSRMHSYNSFYDEICNVMKFPNYFGRNLNALDECLSDLDWLACDRYIIYISNANELLMHENKNDLDGLFELLEKVADEWSKPVSLGEEWDRNAVPFHVILQLPETNNWNIESVE